LTLPWFGGGPPPKRSPALLAAIAELIVGFVDVARLLESGMTHAQIAGAERLCRQSKPRKPPVAADK
jgi:hypothetical protein